MAISSVIPNVLNTSTLKSFDNRMSVLPSRGTTTEITPTKLLSANVDRFTKSSSSKNELSPSYGLKTNGTSFTDSRDGARYNILTISSPDGKPMYTPGGNNDDAEMILSLAQIQFGSGNAPAHPDQDKYDEFNEIFEQTFKDVLSERGLMPNSGDPKNVKIKVGEIYKVYDDVMSRIRADKKASAMIESLGIEYPEMGPNGSMPWHNLKASMSK